MFFRKRRKGGDTGEGVELGEFKGYFLALEVFQILRRPPLVKGLTILAGTVAEGDLAIGDYLVLPNGRVLRAKNIEVRNKRVERVGVNVPCGVLVEGVGWSPDKKDLKPYLARQLIDEIRRELEEKYKGVPKEARERLIEKEIPERLSNLIKSGKLENALKIYSSPGG
ncbi:MAG: hypothetical protein F7C38_01640 [Desulfurococcales archaeon]|nr:hypothetical protein [Desulfurococcales archaeon]